MMTSMIGRKSALWFATAIGVLSFFVTQASADAARERPCNGAVELCSRTLDQVVLPGTHNSMSNEEYGWILPNQHHSIPTQLRMGVRSFLIDTHYGKPAPGVGVSGVDNWNNGADGDPHAAGANTYLCHESCQWGAIGLADELGNVASFLAANPREVLIFVVQDGIHPDDYAKAVTESGLIDYVYTGPTDSYPTLSQMIASNQRVLMLSEGNTGTVPWFHDGYAGPLQETPYDFRRNEGGTKLTTQQSMAQLTDPAQQDSTCRPNRGGTTGRLFLMNHWVNGPLNGGVSGDTFTPDPEVAKVLNQPDVLVARARACEARRGKLPNIVAVDDFGDGDLIGAVRQLNGVSPKAFFEVTKPKNATAKAGKKATFRLKVSNFGDADSTQTKVCATVPGRLANKPRCKTLNVPVSGSASTAITVAAKRKGKGSGAVRFKVTGAGDTVSTSATLKVKPVKNKKPKRKRR